MSSVSTTHLKEINVNVDELESRAHATQIGQHMLVDPADLAELIRRLRVAEQAVRLVTNAAVRACEITGQVVTVERAPLQPLAMGNHAPVVTFRPAREPS